MTRLIRTDSSDSDFQSLVKLLDADLAIRDGKDHAFYAQFNKSNALKHVIVVYEDQEPIACGALREWELGIMELKRMFVQPAYRRKGFAQQVVAGLEIWAEELGCFGLVLETGKNQPEAIQLYQKLDL